MCTLEQLKEQNKAEHESIIQQINLLKPEVKAASNISSTTKWIAGLLLGLITILLGAISIFSAMTYSATAHSKEVEIDSYKTVKALQDTIQKHWEIEIKRYVNEIKPQEKWTHRIYQNEIKKNTERSTRNEKIIQKKLGM